MEKKPVIVDWKRYSKVLYYFSKEPKFSFGTETMSIKADHKVEYIFFAAFW